jgi:hypothetical protein
MDAESAKAPDFHTRQTGGVWYVVARWPADGDEVVKACLSEAEALLWIKNQSQGWVLGRKPPIGETRKQ